jgi:hypothetical protein
MFTFVKVKSVKFNKEWGWYCLINDQISLMLWYMHAQVGEKAAFSITDTLRSKEMNYYFEPTDKKKNYYDMNTPEEQARIQYGHCNNPHGCLIRAHIAKVGKVDLKELAGYMNDMLYKTKADCLEQGKTLLINQQGGFMFLDDSWRVLETQESDIYMFPAPDVAAVKITQWPNGTHYYASVNGARVVVNGVEKWDSHEAAQQAAKKFIKLHAKV